MYLDNSWSDIPLKLWTERILQTSLETSRSFVSCDDDKLIKYEEIIETNNENDYDSDNENSSWYIDDGINRENIQRKRKRMLEKIVKLNAYKLTSKNDINRKLSNREDL